MKKRNILLFQIIIVLGLAILFAFIQKLWIFVLFESYIMCTILKNHYEVRKKNFIFSSIFFNISLIGIALKNLYLHIYDSLFLNSGMFIMGLFFSSFLVLVNLGVEVIYEHFKEKRKHI